MPGIQPKAREGAFLWLIKILAGLSIVIVLGIHFVVNHLVAPEGLLNYSDVVRYYQNPWVVTMEIFFLITVVTHALIGIRSILLDLNPSDSLLSIINLILAVVGVGAVTYGIWLALEIASRGQ